MLVETYIHHNQSPIQTFVINESYKMGSSIFLAAIYQKTQYIINGESDQKSVTNKKDANFNFILGCVSKFNLSTTNIVLLQFQ